MKVFLNHILTSKYPKITQENQNQPNLKKIKTELNLFFQTCCRENLLVSNSPHRMEPIDTNLDNVFC